MEKIDRRKSYYITLDTETTNGFDDPLVYDLGFAVVDKDGKVYEHYSLVVYETFCKMKELMKSAYYANKIPQYLEQIKNGERKIVRYVTAKKILANVCKKYNVKAIMAHNARFDYLSTTTTQRYLTKSKYRYFLPYGVPIWDTLKMAQDTICKQKMYVEWTKKNGYLTKFGRPMATAEVLYKYITGNDEFKESHTGLEDVLIEKEIFAHCVRQHKKMRRACFA